MARKYAKKTAGKGKTFVSLDKRVSKVETSVKKIKSEIEDKVLLYGLGTFTGLQNNAPHYTCLNVLSQGVEDNDRIGNSVTWKYLDLRIFLGIATNAFRSQSVIRVMLVREKPSLGQSLSLNSLLGNSTPTSIDTYNYDNRDWKSRFFVMYDKVHRVDGIMFSKFINIKRKLSFKTNYSRGNSGDYTDIDTNALWLVIFTDYPTDNTSLGYRYEANLFYEDS